MPFVEIYFFFQISNVCLQVSVWDAKVSESDKDKPNVGSPFPSQLSNSEVADFFISKFVNSTKAFFDFYLPSFPFSFSYKK